MEEVALERSRRLGTWTPSWYNTIPSERELALQELAGGRVLSLQPDMYLHEQLEQDECGWYLDEHLTPPIDTWLLYLEEAPDGGSLLAWVPKPFVEGVGQAMEVNTTRCIAWLEDLPCDLGRRFRSLAAGGGSSASSV